MKEVLDATLATWRRTAHIYGSSDCLLSPADYARDLSGVDVGGPWRGTYSTEAEALAIVREAGGAAPLLGGALLRAGFIPVETPGEGDIVVVVAGGVEFGGLCTGPRVALRLARGVTEIRMQQTTVAGAWRWP